MKKLLSLAFVAAIIGASVGCDDKKTSAPAGGKTTVAPGAPASGATGAPSKT
jgi:hypothetical protein